MSTVSSDRQTLFVPCETFGVRIVMAPSTVPTRLERLVMTALHRGARSVDDLETLFEIGHRPMLRLLHDFLNRGFVTFNFTTGEIRLTPQISAAVASEQFKQLEAVERTPERLIMMRDLIAGTVLPIRRRPDRKAGLHVPSQLAAATVISLSSSALLYAVRQQIRRRTTRAGRELHVLDVTLDPPGQPGAQTGEIRDLEIGVRVTVDEASETMTLLVESPDDLPWQTRAGLERALTSLANAAEPHFVFQNLRSKAQPSVTSALPKSIPVQLDELRDLVRRVPAAESGTEATWQENLARLASEIEAAARQDGAHDINSEILGADEQVSAIEAMLASARQQVVIACPFLRYETTRRFRGAIEAALQRGCQFFVLYGMKDGNETLQPGVSSWFQTLRDAYKNRFFYSVRSSRCHAKFVVVDGHDLLMTSYNFLDRPPAEVFEVGLRLTAVARDAAPAGRPTGGFAIDVLELAREIYPEQLAGQLIKASPAWFGDLESGSSLDLRMPTLWTDPEAPSSVETPYRAQRRMLWRREWERHVADLAAQSARGGTRFRLIRNAEHRQLLFEALRTAKSRVVVLSDQLSSRVVSLRFLDELRNCLARGVFVCLIYRRPAFDAQESLRTIAEEYPGRFVRMEASRTEGHESHAKLLICDDWSVITSFNFLSFSGEYEGPDRYLLRTELGMSFHDEPLTRALIDRVRQAMPAALPDAVSTAPARTHVAAPADRPAVAHRPTGATLLDELEELGARGLPPEEEQRGIGEATLKWFSGQRDESAAFDELDELAVIGAPFLDHAIASCLYLYPPAPTLSADHRRVIWLARLVERFWWARRDAGGVYLLLKMAPSLMLPAVPPADVAFLAHQQAHARASAALFEEQALRVAGDPMAALAVAALATEAVLGGADPPRAALEYLGELAPEALRPVIHASLDFRAQSVEGLGAFTIESSVTLRDSRSQMEASRQELIAELRRCVGLSLDFSVGRRAWGWLIHSPLGFKAMLEASERGDLAAIRETLRGHAGHDADRLLDTAVKALVDDGRARDVPIQGKHRRLLLFHINKVTRAATAWSDHARRVEHGAQPASERMLHTLATHVQQSIGDARGLAETLRAEARYPAPVLDQLLDTLRPLLRLAS